MPVIVSVRLEIIFWFPYLSRQQARSQSALAERNQVNFV